MRQLNLLGSLPTLIRENTPPWDWVGQLRLNLDPALIRFVDVAGTGGDFFDATLNRQFGTLLITPIARVDFEGFARGGLAAELSLGFRFFMTDGTVAEAVQRFMVAVLDVDDTPPQSLSLSTGGAIPLGVAGATIGTLAATDPDTARGFTYTIREDDAWMFEVAGSTLRLKPGVMLSEADGPLRAVTIDVSDGHQSAAFTVTFAVTDPRAPAGQVANLLQPGQSKAGFSWSAEGVLRADVMSGELRAIDDYGSLLRITLDGGASIWVDQPRVVDLLDGRILDTSADRAVRIWEYYDLVMDREPPMESLRAIDHWMSVGATERQVAKGLFDASPLKWLSSEALPRRLYETTLGWAPADGVAYHKARLDAGLAPEQLLTEFVDWRMSWGHEQARVEQGLFVPRPNAHQVGALLEAGGFASGPGTRWWIEQINAGVYSLGTLAGAVPSTEGWRVGWGSVDDRAFAPAFFRVTMGRDLDPLSSWWWGEQLASDTWSRADFMALIVNNLASAAGLGSPFLDKPDALSFGADWF
jgi:hypothetical protein